MRLLPLQILVLVLDLGGPSVLAQDNIVPLVLGPDFQRAYSHEDIFRGFKLNVAEGEAPLKNHVFEGDIISSPSSTSYTKSAVIKTVEDINDMMGIQGSLSVSYGPMISGSGAGSYLQSKVKSKRQISVLYQSRRVAYAKKVDVKTLKPIAGLDELTSDEIADRYGSKFIDQMLYGAQLDVIFTIKSREDANFTKIEAELKGRIGVGALSVEFEAKFEKKEGHSQSEYTMEIEARASGIAFGVPANPTFDQVNKLIDDFNFKYEELLSEVSEGENVDSGNVANQFSPVAFALSPISRYLNAGLSIDETARFDDKMKDLRDVFSHALFLKSQIKKIRDEQELLYGGDPKMRIEIFQPYDNAVSGVNSELDLKIDECLDYRKKTVQEIVGTSAKVPNKYPSSEAEEKVVKGLIGKAYLPSPVTIGDATFEEFYYVGFALPSESVGISPNSNYFLVPWMGGELRLEDNESAGISAETPDDLAQMGLAWISSDVKYGDQIFLQVSSIDYRWLKRDDSTGNAMSTDYLAEASQPLGTDYQWRVKSKVGHDDKQGQCIRYGDTIFLNSQGAWLNWAPDGKCIAPLLNGGSCVNTAENGFQTAHLKWRVRSTLGTGSLETETNPDPAHGQCIQLNSKIYLQSNNEENLWLTGGRSARQTSVWALNFHIDKPLSAADYHQIGVISDETKCMDIQPGTGSNNVNLRTCKDSSLSQLFRYDAETNEIKHDATQTFVRKVKVRHQFDRKGTIELAEIKVIDGNGINKALGKRTSQSTTYYRFSSPRAVDGDEDSFSHTSDFDQYGAWFELDLGELVEFKKIEIWSRSDCCQERLIGATVSLFDGNGRAWASATLPEAKRTHSFPSASFLPLCLHNGDGILHKGDGIRKVKVHHQPRRKGTIELAQIKVIDGNGVNKALGRGTSQSTTYEPFSSSRAVDGNGDTFSHTSDQYGAWFELDLGELVEFQKIEIWSRSGYQGRLIGATVSLIDDTGRAWASATISEAKQTHAFPSASFVANVDVKPVYMDSCNGGDDQKWHYNSNTMELKTYSRCLDMASTGHLNIQECHGGASPKIVIPSQLLGYRYGDYEKMIHQSYEWIVRKEVGDGSRDDGFFCPAAAAKGSWKLLQLQTMNGPQYEIGIQRTIDFPHWEQTSSWEDSVTSSVTNGFQFGSQGINVPLIDAREMEASVRSVLHDPKFISDDNAISGQVWQFVYEISDACAPSWELKTKELVVTKDAGQEPCCLPGRELDAAQPHGPCKFWSACQCEDSICYPTAAPTEASPSTDEPTPSTETPEPTTGEPTPGPTAKLTTEELTSDEPTLGTTIRSPSADNPMEQPLGAPTTARTTASPTKQPTDTSIRSPSADALNSAGGDPVSSTKDSSSNPSLNWVWILVIAAFVIIRE